MRNVSKLSVNVILIQISVYISAQGQIFDMSQCLLVLDLGPFRVMCYSMCGCVVYVRRHRQAKEKKARRYSSGQNNAERCCALGMVREIRERGSFPRTETRFVENKSPTDFVFSFVGGRGVVFVTFFFSIACSSRTIDWPSHPQGTPFWRV